MRNAKQQAAYVDAVMVNAAWEQHKFMQRPADEFLGKTQALTVTYNGFMLYIYSNYATAAGNTKWKTNQQGTVYPDKLEFHQYQLQVAILDDPDHFPLAKMYLRNARDWCRKRTIDCKDELHEYVRSMADDSNASAGRAVRSLWRTPIDSM
jgi:hypothetical protein